MTQHKSICSLDSSAEEWELSYLFLPIHIPIPFSLVIKKANVASMKKQGRRPGESQLLTGSSVLTLAGNKPITFLPTRNLTSEKACKFPEHQENHSGNVKHLANISSTKKEWLPLRNFFSNYQFIPLG